MTEQKYQINTHVSVCFIFIIINCQFLNLITPFQFKVIFSEWFHGNGK